MHRDNSNPEPTSRKRRPLPAPNESVRQTLDRWTGGKTAIPPDRTRSALVPPTAKRHPQPFGIPWLDTLLAGGLAPGEVLLFLAPTGAGKTTLATQMAFTRASQRRHAAYLTYDQPLAGDIENRFFSMMTGVSRRQLERGGVAAMPPSIQQRFLARREACGSYLHLYDLSGRAQGRGGIGDIRDVVGDETNRGRPPSLLIVDWLQCAVRRAMGSAAGSSKDLAQAMDAYAQQFAQLCRDLGVQGVLLQQLDTDHQRSSGIHLDHRMAQGCTTLGRHCDHALVLGRLKPDGLGLMVNSKAACLPEDRPRQVVRLDGDFNRFEAADGWEYDRRTGGLVLKPSTAPDLDHRDSVVP